MIIFFLIIESTNAKTKKRKIVYKSIVRFYSYLLLFLKKCLNSPQCLFIVSNILLYKKQYIINF